MNNPLEQTPLVSGAAELDIATAAQRVQLMREEIAKAVVGQQQVIDQVLVGLFAGGHIVVEGLPGLGKTLLLHALARTFAGKATRIQFTPDLMPADITGHVMFDVRSGEFQVRRGPVFTNLLLADEINRAPAKTQAAMLEVMQEGQVTIEGVASPLPPPFMTLATQNPLEHEGTYPLPDAQLDRFLLKIHIAYPDEQEEIDMVQRITKGHVGDRLRTAEVQQVVDVQGVLRIQQLVASLHVDPSIIAYAVRLVRATREWPGLHAGAGPRGCLALVRAARACALIAGREYVLPDDVKNIALAALRHRIRLAPEAELEGLGSDSVLTSVFERVEAPRV